MRDTVCRRAGDKHGVEMLRVNWTEGGLSNCGWQSRSNQHAVYIFNEDTV